MNRSIPILMYHQIGPQTHPSFTKYTVTPRAFALQMAWLMLARYVPITFDRLLAWRAGQGRLPERAVIITFDDGFQGCDDYAVPTLLSRGFTAVFYIVAGLAGRTSRWLIAERGVEFPLMDWATIRRLEATGFQCGAHTMSHPRLPELPMLACRQELEASKRLLEDQLGHEVRDMAYPFGSFDERVRELAAEAGYRSACTVQIGRSPGDDDPLALHRIPILGSDTLLDFICRLESAWPLRDTLRHSAGSTRRWLLRKLAATG
ncbi:MAG TPA: polysaccharide deacetylase family protein [Roseiflexaceae bacterium]|nr:polysaccharide deacetylase family protein [Roseiflexaceae bacterium]